MSNTLVIFKILTSIKTYSQMIGKSLYLEGLAILLIKISICQEGAIRRNIPFRILL